MSRMSSIRSYSGVRPVESVSSSAGKSNSSRRREISMHEKTPGYRSSCGYRGCLVDLRRPRLNRVWLEELALMANSVGGLVVVPEPPAGDPTAADVPDVLPADRTGTGSPRAGSWRQAPT